jgi:hypothetical protein
MLKYILEVIVITYVIRLVFRFFDKGLLAKSNPNSQQQASQNPFEAFTNPSKANQQSQTSTTTKKVASDDYIDYEEVK